jgi:hypothetical protein
MTPKDIHPGLVLRVVWSYGLGTHRHALATIVSVETSPAGDWYCVVRYHDTRQPRQGTRLYRSHLWAVDLGRLEIVKGWTEKSGAGRSMAGASRPRPKGEQLVLPFLLGDDDDYTSAFTTAE